MATKIDQAIALTQPLILDKDEVLAELGINSMLEVINEKIIELNTINKNQKKKERINTISYEDLEEDDLEYSPEVEKFLEDFVGIDLDARRKVIESVNKKKQSESFTSHVGRLIFREGKRIIIKIIKRVFKLTLRIAWNAIRIVTTAFWRFIARPILTLLADFLLTPVGLGVVAVLALTGIGYLAYKEYSGQSIFGRGDTGEGEPSIGETGTSTEPATGKGYSTKGESVEIKKIFEEVSKNTGVPVQTFTAIAARESNFNPGIDNGVGSHAAGLFQFMPSTWSGIIKNYGDKYGIPDSASRYDPYYSTVAEAAFIREEIYPAVRSIKPDVTITDIYLGHFLGAGKLGAKLFLRTLQSNPSKAAYTLFSKGVSSLNKPYFYDKQGNARSVQQMYDYLTSLLTNSTVMANNKISTKSTAIDKIKTTNKPEDKNTMSGVLPITGNGNKQFLRYGGVIASYP